MAQQEINYWLMKSEPDAYSINQLKKESTTLWDGIRNYQARNFMRSMKIGDQAFFYHSNCNPPGIVGFMEVIKTNLIDPTQFDSTSKYFDPKSSSEKPKWDCAELKEIYSPEELQVVRKGNRLSITPILPKIAINLLHRLGNPMP